MKPIRIQRRRIKGWKMPENTISVTRPGRFGNPFKVGYYVKLGQGGFGYAYLICWEEKYAKKDYVKVRDNAHAVELFREYLRRYPLHQNKIDFLRGKNLACFCPIGEPCHADILLELTNEKDK